MKNDETAVTDNGAICRRYLGMIIIASYQDVDQLF